MGKVIGIDTSERIPNITILEKEKIVLMEKTERDFHEDIPYFLEKKGIKPEELTGIGVGIGPGSFTGLRVGLSFATALSLALKIPIKGVITLEGMVASVEKD
ncbi:tRNA (adenosine(37)-N6)-threonylcarbamoyltransferase complex dimerization subunit type 1 TsaB, partial [bacterium]